MLSHGPPIPHGPASPKVLGTIFEGEARGGFGAGEWVKIPFETRWDQELEDPG